MKTRVRACDKPEPAFGGKNCSKLGSASEIIPCNKQKCPGIGSFLFYKVLLTWSCFVSQVVFMLSADVQYIKLYYPILFENQILQIRAYHLVLIIDRF